MKRKRKTTADYAVPGERAVLELLDAAPGRVHRILASRPFPAVEEAASGIPIERVGPEDLRALTEGADSRGIVAIADPPPLRALAELVDLALACDGPRKLLVALDGLQDPHNVGAIARSCEFFGVSGMFWPRDRACSLTPAVARASAGATERLPLGQVTNLAEALRQCKDAGMWVVGTVVEGGQSLDRMCADDRLPAALVLVLGSEGSGLRRLTRDRCDYLVSLPRTGRIGSLNVSAAAAATLAILTTFAD